MTKRDMAEEIMVILQCSPGTNPSACRKVQDLLDRMLAPESGQDKPFPPGVPVLFDREGVLISVKPILAAGGRIIIEPATEAQP